jgi:hypothetical protein
MNPRGQTKNNNLVLVQSNLECTMMTSELEAFYQIIPPKAFPIMMFTTLFSLWELVQAIGIWWHQRSYFSLGAIVTAVVIFSNDLIYFGVLIVQKYPVRYPSPAVLGRFQEGNRC